MAEVQNLSDIQQEIVFVEFDFYQFYEKTFQNTEPERMKRLLPLLENTARFGLLGAHSEPYRERQ